VDFYLTVSLQCPAEGCCEHGNELSGLIKSGNPLINWATINFYRKALHH